MSTLPVVTDSSGPIGRIGLIVNPIAGLGGRVGLNGSDGQRIQRAAVSLGAVPLAGSRTVRAISQLRGLPYVEVVTAPGAMGADLCREAGVPHTVLDVDVSSHVTAARDTRRAVELLEHRGIDLIMFAGGDGTARDVSAALTGDSVVLGIPTGVKMHSGVFAATPEAAGRAAAAWLSPRNPRSWMSAEIADIDESARREGRVSARLYGVVRVPQDPKRVLPSKGQSVRTVESAMRGACEQAVRGLREDAVVVVGPGTSTKHLLSARGLPASLLGVDAFTHRRSIGVNLSERELIEIVSDAPQVRLVVGVIGCQGVVLGRGDQQISPDVLRLIGPENLRVVADLNKLIGLSNGLTVDSGDRQLDRSLGGHLRVLTSYSQSYLMPVTS